MTLSRHTRSTLLIAAGAMIVGWGCIPIKLPQKADADAEKTFGYRAEAGDPLSQLQLGLAYRFGSGGVRQNSVEAWRWLSKSAEGGNTEAKYIVAEALWRGDLGQPRQIEKGLNQMRSLAAKGGPSQQVRLASLLESDTSMGSNFEEAIQWYEIAARRGSFYAAQRLGYFYESGKGVKKDLSVAWAWYQLADAQNDLRRLGATMSPEARRAGEISAKALQGELTK